MKDARLDINFHDFLIVGNYGASPTPTLSERFILRSFPGEGKGFTTGSWLLFEVFCGAVTKSIDEIIIIIAIPTTIPITAPFFKMFCKSENSYKDL